MSHTNRSWRCACGAGNPPEAAACSQCRTDRAAGARADRGARPRRRKRTPSWVLWGPVGLLLLVLAAGLISRTVGSGASTVLARPADGGSPLPSLPFNPTGLPAAPGAISAVPEPAAHTRKAPPVTATKPSRPVEVPAAPSMVTAPSAPEVRTPPVVHAPAAPVPAAPTAPPVVAAVPEPPRPEAPSPSVVSAPVPRPEPKPAVTGAPEWTETEIDQEIPVVRIYNQSTDDGNSVLLLRNKTGRYRVLLRRPYGEVELPAGDYQYELYFSRFSFRKPIPDQVGTLHCNKYRMYSLRTFDTPMGGFPRRKDVGDLP